MPNWTYEGLELPIEYIKGNSADFVVYIQALGQNAQIASVEGHARWIVTRDDGSQFIARPQEANK